MLDAASTSPVVSALGWAVLHFLWQGGVIAGLAALVFSGLRERSAQARYVVGCLALVCSLPAFAMTFAVSLPLEGTPTPALVTMLPCGGSSISASSLDGIIPLVAWLWCAGACLTTARFTVQRMAMQGSRNF